MLEVECVETPGLGDRSYIVSGGGTAVVVDPQRDIDRITALTAGRRLRISHVLETHIHNDYVSGGLELSRRSGAEYVISGGEVVDFPRRAVADGDELDCGSFRVRVLETPGHTENHLSYVAVESGRPCMAFTGGSLLLGPSVARTSSAPA